MAKKKRKEPPLGAGLKKYESEEWDESIQQLVKQMDEVTADLFSNIDEAETDKAVPENISALIQKLERKDGSR